MKRHFSRGYTARVVSTVVLIALVSASSSNAQTDAAAVSGNSANFQNGLRRSAWDRSSTPRTSSFGR